MDNSNHRSRLISQIILATGIAYLLFLIWAILWKCGVPFIGDGSMRGIDLVPFDNNTRWELQFNIALFFPFGFYLAACKTHWPFVKLIAACLLVSLLLELTQYVLAIGLSDVTDLLLNTLGGIIGIAVFYAITKLLGSIGLKIVFVICILLFFLILYMTISFIALGQLNFGFMLIRL